MTPDIIEFIQSDKYLGPDLQISPAQTSILKAIYGIDSFTAEEAEAFDVMTEGRKPRKGGYSDVWIIAGRRSGKTDKILANVAAYETFTFDDSELAKGERAYFPIVAQDLEGAGRARGYVEGKLLHLDRKYKILDQGSAQSRAITGKQIRTTTGVTVQTFPCSKASVRGLTAIGYATDESAFWETADGAYNPDKEVFRALRPTVATSGRRAKKINVTSPYAEEGVAFEAFRDRGTSRALVIHAPTWLLNPNIDRAFLAEQEFLDPVAYLREYGAQFGREGGGFLSPDEIERAIDKSRPAVLPREPGQEYVGAIDVGFKHDLYAMGICHLDAGVVVFDVIQWRKGTKKVPLDGPEVAREYSEIFRAYGIDRILADQYCDLSVKKDYSDCGITVDTENASEALNFEEAKNFKSAVRRGNVNLPDDPMIRRDLMSVRRLGGGRFPRIAAPEKMGFHDDIFRVCCKGTMDRLPIASTADLAKLNEGANPLAGLPQEARQLVVQRMAEREGDTAFPSDIMSEVY